MQRLTDSGEPTGNPVLLEDRSSLTPHDITGPLLQGRRYVIYTEGSPAVDDGLFLQIIDWTGIKLGPRIPIALHVGSFQEAAIDPFGRLLHSMKLDFGLPACLVSILGSFIPEANHPDVASIYGLTMSTWHADCSHCSHMATLIHELRYALRVLNKNRGYVLIALLTLTLGIAANITVFSATNAFFSRLMAVPEARFLVRVCGGEDGIDIFSYPNYLRSKRACSKPERCGKPVQSPAIEPSGSIRWKH